MEKVPVIYDAAGEYAKEQRNIARTGNVPARIMAEMRGAALNQLIGNPMAQAASTPGFSGEIAKWNTYTKEQKLERIIEIADVDQMRSAMIMEEDNDILRVMIDRKEDIEKFGK